MTTLITILFLIILNGFFSLSEMAIVSSNKPILRAMSRRGNKGADDVLKLLENQGKFLSTIQVGITAVGTLAAAYGGATVAASLEALINKIPFLDNCAEGIAITIVVFAITYFSVVIGELIPKRIALRNPENISILVARPMISISHIFFPLVRIFDLSAEIVMKFFGIFTTTEDKVTEADLRAIISEGAESGVIEKSEHEMMQRIFRLDNRDAKSIMTHISEVTLIKTADSIDEIRRKIREAGHSKYPVIDSETQKIIGVAQTKELLSGVMLLNEIDIKNHLKEVHFISENTNCLKLLEMFKSASIHLAVVIDEYGEVEGIVTDSDVFEAIVGLLPANYDEKDFVMIRKRDDDSWVVDGMTPIDEIHILIGIEEINVEGGFDTIAGFLLDHLNKVPQEGDKVIKYGYSFEIIDMDGMRVDKILIKNIGQINVL